ncbi:MAG TPA: hypothetical protein VFA20_05690 [Myxococcaceae bacterium]|nr:hypothetical protein [Myxococcaceae bacterium]
MNLPSLRPALRALGAALLLAALPALAEGPTEPHDRLIAGTWTVGRVSPIGFDQQVSLTFKERIGDSEDLLFKTRSWQVGVMGAYNPANWSARVEAMVEPVAFFQLRAAYDVRGFFGIFGALLSTNDGNWNICTACVDAANMTSDFPGFVQGVTVEPALQAALGPFVFRNTFGFEFTVWNLHNGDRFVYDPGPDLLRAAQGWTLTETATLGYLGSHLFAGVQYIWVNPVDLPSQRQHRVAALAAWTFYDRGVQHGLFNKPTLVAVAFWNIVKDHDRDFTIVAGFASESDLLGLFGAAPK